MTEKDRTKWNEAEIIDAVRGEGLWCQSDGRAIPVHTFTGAAKRLKITATTLLRYRERWPSINEAFKEAREYGLDLAEDKLFDLIDEGEFPAVKLALESRGVSRGYGKRALIRANLRINDPFSDLTDDDLDRILDDDLESYNGAPG